MAKKEYKYGTLGSCFTYCSRRPRQILEELKEARVRRKQMFAAKRTLEKIADLEGEISSWGNQIILQVKSPTELKRAMAAFGGIFNKQWNNYNGTFNWTRSTKYNDYWDIKIDQERSASCKVNVVKKEVTHTETRYELVPGSCDPLTETIDDVQVA